MKRALILLLGLALAAAACGDSAETTTTTAAGTTTTAAGTTTAPTTEPPGDMTVTLVTNNAFSANTFLLDPFTAETGIQVEFIAGGDTGAMVNQAILTKDNPLGDVLYGFDNTFLSRVLAEDIFEPYESPNAANAMAGFQDLDPENRVTAVDFGDVCINYDKGWFEENDLAVPQTLDDLRDPAYSGLLTVENPALASPGLAFMLATVAAYGEDGWLDFWADLRENDVEVVNGWDEAYYTSFSGSSGAGPRPMVVSYASSPPAEVIFADPQPDEAPTGVMLDSCFRQIEFIGILRGAENVEAAQALIDWWLTPAMQAELPLNYFVFPVTDVPLPDAFVEHTDVPENPHTLDPAAIAENRDRWIEEWTSTVLR